MTGALDAELGPETVELIAEYGATTVLNRVSVGAYNPSTGKNGMTFGDDETMLAAVEDERGLVVMPDGSSVKGDKKFYVAALGFTLPAIDSKVTVLGVTYRILQTKTIMSGELPCLYILWAWT